MRSLILVALMVPSSAWAQSDRPNIVIVLADDMGYSDIGCYGGEIRTPNLDMLAAGGVRFTQFYNTGRCCPTRASLMTGLYPHQAGVGMMVHDAGRPGYRGHLNESCVTIAEVLGESGYATAIAGKWHVTPFDYNTMKASHRASWPLQRGFGRFTGSLAGGGSYYRPKGWVEQNAFAPTGEGFYYTDAVTEAAEGFIADTPDDQPLFLYIAYTAPHWPLHAHEADIDSYEGVYDRGWDAVRASRLERMKAMGIVSEDCALSPRDSGVPPWSDDLERRDVHIRRMQTYAAQIECMDRGIGRVVEQLKKRGRFDNTLFVFLADNGGCNELLNGKSSQRFAWPGQESSRWGNEDDVKAGGMASFQSYGVGWANASNTPFRRYKKNSHEGGIATPLILHWPRGLDASRRGKLDHQTGHSIDIMATCIDVAGAEYPVDFKGRAITPLQGVSLLPAMHGESRVRKQPLFFEHAGHRAIRVGDWKLVKLRGKPWELYDLETDRPELANLAGAHPNRVKQLSETWLSWAAMANVLSEDEVSQERQP